MKIPRWMWALALVTATMPFWDLGHALWEVDDARYAEVPRETVELNDWVTPHLNYMDYVEKPPLIYWITACSYSVFGVSEAASRVPLAFLAILGLCGIAWLGSWMFFPQIGLTAAILLGTCVEYSILSHLQTPDMAVTVFLLWTTALLWRGLNFPRDRRWAYPAAGAAAGLAFLSKGLISILFPAGWLVLILIFIPKIRQRLSAGLFLYSIPVFLLVASPWIVAMAHRHPTFLHYFFIEQHFQRFLTKEFARYGPWYYYFVVNPIGLLPWTPAVLTALALPLFRWKKTDPGIQQLWIWAALIFIFFSKSNSKLPTYILPIMPQECLLAAELLHRVIRKSIEQKWISRISLGLGALFCAAIPVGIWMRSAGRLPGLVTANLTATGSLILLSLAIILLASARNRGESAIRWTSWPAFAVTALMLIGARQAEAYLSAKEVSQEIRSQFHAGDQIVAYDAYQHGIAFYLKRPVDLLLNWRGELRYDENDPRFRDHFGEESLMKNLPTTGHSAFVVMPHRIVDHFLTVIPPGKVRSMKPFGNFALAVLQS